MPFPFRFQVGRASAPAARSSGCPSPPRTAGAVATGEPVTARYSIADAEAGRIESIRLGVLALSAPRSAGDAATLARLERERLERERRGRSTTSSTAATSDANAAPFDPRDPASMTEARWRAMTPETQRAWIDANVRDEARKAQMITDIANGVFGAVRDFIRGEQAQRTLETTEAALSERNRTNQQEETRRHLATQETERFRAQAQQARDEAAAARLREEGAQNETQRLRAQAEADQARERQARADADLAAARAREQEATAAAERERLATIQANVGFFATTGGKIVAGVGAVAVIGVLTAIAIKALTPPPPPPPPPALPPQVSR